MTDVVHHPGAGVVLALNSKNAKLGAGCAATYVSPTTCPASCPLRGNGCYAEAFEAYVPGLRALMRAAVDPRAAIQHEALTLAYFGGVLLETGVIKNLRLHVVGDVLRNLDADSLALGCAGWPGHVWTYTHSWRVVQRACWGRISVLASIDHFDQAAEALALGYASAIVVGQVSEARFDRDGVRWTHCPAQRNVKQSCSTCRLCWHADKLVAARRGVVFETHGQRRTKARMALEQCRLFEDES